MFVFRIAFFILFQTSMAVLADENKSFILQLEGKWKFSIGDDKNWANPDFDDSAWEPISVPSAWEDQGFFGYDGYAWYRNSFIVTREMKTKEIFISLGYINDVDQVYINGHLIGFSGSFPPDFSSATEALRKYPIPIEFLNGTGKNIIAVRVYNFQMSGGIVSGEVGIFSYNIPKSDLSLSGLWLFHTGDNLLWKSTDCKDKQWDKIVVPGNWENQGFKDYNGIAWYRKHFTVTKEYTTQKIMLILGKIDNSDEVYLNGILIGSTGNINGDKNKKTEAVTEKYNHKLRAYSIPDNLLSANKENILTIRVSDLELKGGIIDGPLGLIKLTNFNHLFKEFELSNSK
jgi:hypothetical protein